MQNALSTFVSVHNVRKHAKIAACIMLVIMALTSAVVWKAAVYVNTHDFDWKSPVSFQWILSVSAKQEPAAQTIVLEAEQHATPLTPDQQYLCDVFSKTSQKACVTALAIQRHENGTGVCDRYGINTNGTLDWGFMQINTLHLKRADVKLVDLLDCHANIDFAYKLFVEHGGNRSLKEGFSPWVTYQNGSYKSSMVNPTFR